MNWNNLSYNHIKKEIGQFDLGIAPTTTTEYEKESVKKELNLSNLFKEQNVSVLGLDIYQYSKYEFIEQSLIPIVLKIIIEETNLKILQYEKFLFQHHINNSKLNLDTIDTGDGGFFIFETPLHSIIYALILEFHFRAFNSGKFYPKLKSVIGSLTVRYAITMNKVFKLDKNFYGPAIINNARIMSHDKLNRCLIDEITMEWFLKTINGFEGLKTNTLEDISKIPPFTAYPDRNNVNINFSTMDKHYTPSIQSFGITDSHIQKIGEISPKLDKVSIYNVYLQFSARLLSRDDNSKGTDITYSLGNLNTSGIHVT